MKKYYFFLALALCLGLAACGGDDENENLPKQQENTTEQNADTQKNGEGKTDEQPSDSKPTDESTPQNTDETTPKDPEPTPVDPDEPSTNDGMKAAEAVDLGLSVKWASWNVGASAPEELGNYYAWGETEPKIFYQDVNYKVPSKWGDYRRCFCITSSIGSTDPEQPGSRGLINGISRYDVACKEWGDGWEMPTRYEVEELYEKCAKGEYELNGVKGMLFVGPNEKTIFLPYGGYKTDQVYRSDMLYYWTSSWEWDGSYDGRFPLILYGYGVSKGGHPNTPMAPNAFSGALVRPVKRN